MRILRKILKGLLYFIGSLLFIIIVLLLFLWIKSPGKADPITDLKGNIVKASISTIEKLTLGGLEQSVIIRGADSTKAVMLFLQGGPGGSGAATFMKTFNPDIEKDYVMVYWEQRGAGKSYSKDIPVESMNLEQFISDTRELSEILAKRFKKEKIYLMGSSWGSFLGILTAYKHPELYHSFIGTGQFCYLYRNEQISHDWAIEQAIKNKNDKAIKVLSELTLPDSTANPEIWLDYLETNQKYVNEFGGAIYKKPSMWTLIKTILFAKEHTFAEKLYFIKPGTSYSLKHLWSDMMNKNLFNDIDSIQVPVYIFQGKHDYVTPYPLAKNFFDKLKAPKKAFFTFEESAHGPYIEEPAKFNLILRETILEK